MKMSQVKTSQVKTSQLKPSRVRMSRGLMSFGLLVAGVLAVARTSEGAPSATPAPVAAPTDSPLVGDAITGKEAFTQYCSICHGVGAKGFIGPRIAGIDWTVPGLQAIVRGGVGGYGSMPAFNADAVTDKNIADIAAYLVSLAPASTPKSAATSATSSQAVAVAASSSPTATSAPAAAGSGTAPSTSTSGNTTAPQTSTSGSAQAPPTSASSASRPASSTAGDPVHGHQVYSANCAACHGANAQGGVGPALRGEKNRKDLAAAIAWIKNPKLPMPKLYPSVITEKDVEDVAAYVESL
jgi:mono/diheme cytochrome c family protein